MSTSAKCFIIGHIGKEKPELKKSVNGTEFCKFSVATRERKDGPTSWWNVSCFGNTAKFVSTYLDAGSYVLVEGRMAMQPWEKDGQKRESLGITASNIQGLGRKEETLETSTTLPPASEPFNQPIVSDWPEPSKDTINFDNIPF